MKTEKIKITLMKKHGRFHECFLQRFKLIMTEKEVIR